MFSGWSFTRPLLTRIQALANPARHLIGRLGSGLAVPAVTASEGPSAAVSSSTVTPAASLTLADQWNRLAGLVSAAIDRTDAVRDIQVAATQQLDLAQYGIITLVDELAAVMTLPGRSGRPATIHAIAGQPRIGDARKTAGQALAA